MTQINPHINFNGNAEEAFNLYKSVFGGEFMKVLRFKDMAGPDFQPSEKEADKIMYISLRIAKDHVLIGNDVPEIMGRTNERENRSKIAIGAESREEAERLFEGLSAGGEVEFPMGESPWGSYYGGLRDKYGIEWTIEHDPQYDVHT